MRIALVRGAYLNRYEMQSYEPLTSDFSLTGFSSLRPIHSKFNFPVIKLSSPMDLPNFPYKMPVLNRIFGDSQVLFGLEKKLKGFDIAHSAETYFYCTQQCLQAKAAGLVKAVVCTVWENITFNNEGIRLRKKFKNRALNEVDHFICVTNQAKKALIKEGCDKNKISVIYPGIDLQKFKAQSLKLKVKDSKRLIILFVGRLENEKGIWELLNAFKDLVFSTDNSTLKLKIIGSGNQKNKINKFINNDKLDNQITVKTVSYEKIQKEYREADIFILPSKRTKYWQEQFGMVLVEAMACGLPIITTQSGAIPEVIGEAGILVREGSSNELFKAMTMLINNISLRKKLAKLGRKRVEDFFDAQKQSKKIADIYHQLLEK